LRTHRVLAASLAKATSAEVMLIDYRLAPESQFPAQIDDALNAYRWLLAEGYRNDNVIIAGDAAGGNIAIETTLRQMQVKGPLPAAVIAMSPLTDLAATGESIRTNAERCAMFSGSDIAPTARYYLGDTDPRNPLASPLYANLAGLPPLLIHVGEDEVLRDDSTRLAERARAAGVPVELKIWPVVPHAWQLAPHKIPEGRQSLREAAEFLRAHAANADSGKVKMTHA